MERNLSICLTSGYWVDSTEPTKMSNWYISLRTKLVNVDSEIHSPFKFTPVQFTPVRVEVATSWLVDDLVRATSAKD